MSQSLNKINELSKNVIKNFIFNYININFFNFKLKFKNIIE